MTIDLDEKEGIGNKGGFQFVWSGEENAMEKFLNDNENKMEIFGMGSPIGGTVVLIKLKKVTG